MAMTNGRAVRRQHDGMHQHKSSVTSSYAFKLVTASVVVAILSAIGVVAYLGGAGGSSVQVLASAEAEAGSAIGTAANFQDVQAEQATTADAPAPALVDSNNDGAAPENNLSADNPGPENHSGGADVEAVPPVCPEGSVPVAAACAIVDCVYGYVYNGTKCESLCTDNTAWDGSQCQPISIHCIPGMTWTGTECVSLCDGNEVWVGAECVTPECPAGTSWNGVGCVAAETECPAGTWPIGDGCAFVDCSAGHIFNGTECESICPSIATWNGSECIIAQAVCPVGTVRAPEGCELVDCVRGLIFNGIDCITADYDCEDGSIPTSWGCSPTDCGVPGQVLSNGECRTTCPGGVIVAGDCLPVVCHDGANWNGVQCIVPGPACPFGQIPLDGECTQLGFENVPGLEVLPELFSPELEIIQAIPALPPFPGN